MKSIFFKCLQVIGIASLLVVTSCASKEDGIEPKIYGTWKGKLVSLIALNLRSTATFTFKDDGTFLLIDNGGSPFTTFTFKGTFTYIDKNRELTATYTVPQTKQKNTIVLSTTSAFQEFSGNIFNDKNIKQS